MFFHLKHLHKLKTVFGHVKMSFFITHVFSALLCTMILQRSHFWHIFVHIMCACKKGVKNVSKMIKMASGTEFESYRHTSICVVGAKNDEKWWKVTKTHVFGSKMTLFWHFKKVVFFVIFIQNGSRSDRWKMTKYQKMGHFWSLFVFGWKLSAVARKNTKNDENPCFTHFPSTMISMENV